MAKEFKVKDYTEFLNDEMYVSDSLYNARPYTDYSDSVEYESLNDADMQQIYTGGIFRTSKGKNRAQMIADPQSGFNSFQIYLDNVLRMELFEDQMRFFSAAGVLAASLLASSGGSFNITAFLGNINLNPDTAGGGVVNSDGNVEPNLDATYDLGEASFRWRDLYLSGDINSSGIISASSIVVDFVFFNAQTVTPTIDGQMFYFDDMGVQNMRVRMAGVNFTFDLSFL